MQRGQPARAACWERAGGSHPKREFCRNPLFHPGARKTALNSLDFHQFQVQDTLRLPKWELEAIPVHGYHMVSGAGRAAGRVIWRRYPRPSLHGPEPGRVCRWLVEVLDAQVLARGGMIVDPWVELVTVGDGLTQAVADGGIDLTVYSALVFWPLAPTAGIQRPLEGCWLPG